jgi:branched-chain amino acid transport system substrate-binding protein
MAGAVARFLDCHGRIARMRVHSHLANARAFAPGECACIRTTRPRNDVLNAPTLYFRPGISDELPPMHPPTRRRILATAGATLAARLAGAANPQPKPASALVGAVLPLSGDLALPGDECLRGIQLAANAIPLVVADAIDQSHTPAAVNALITSSHANILLGTGDSDLCYPGSAAAELAQLPYIELNAPADGITTRGFKFLLRTGPTTSMISALAISTLLTRFKGQKIGLLFNTGATAGAIAGPVLAAMAAAKTPPELAIGYSEDVMDLYDSTGRLMRAGAQVVLHAAGPADALAFFAAMAEQNWRPRQILGCGAGYALAENAAALGTDLDGTLVIAAPFYPASAAAIATAYTARFGTPPRSPDSLSAYVGAKLVFDTLNAAGGDPTKLLDALRKTNLPSGSLANGWGVAFDHTGQNSLASVALPQWRGGRLVPV